MSLRLLAKYLGSPKPTESDSLTLGVEKLWGVARNYSELSLNSSRGCPNTLGGKQSQRVVY